jgi:hypothetical protein
MYATGILFSHKNNAIKLSAAKMVRIGGYDVKSDLERSTLHVFPHVWIFRSVDL